MIISKSEEFFCYLLKISYDGGHYYGWQRQSDFDKTIQEVFLTILSQICNSKDIKVLGSSRTDKGVHAIAQYCKITIPKKFSCEKLHKSLECMLPGDISVESIKEIPKDYKLMSSVYSKTYQYLFLPGARKIHPVASRWVVPLAFDMDMTLLNSGAEIFIGEHDFKNYKVMGTETSSTIRTIYRSKVLKLDEINTPLPFIPNGTLAYRVEGSGFLKQMVRLMIGAITAHGGGKIPLSILQKSLHTTLERKLSAPLPAHGLTLIETKFRN